MREIFTLYPSVKQLGVLLFAHGLVALAALAYLRPAWMALAAATLMALLAIRESRQLLAQRMLRLEIDTAGGHVRLEENGQSYFYDKYKVYPTRWFAILRLIDKGGNRTLILNSERFETLRDYRRLRRALCAGERLDVA